jgi:hypothetical protein
MTDRKRDPRDNPQKEAEEQTKDTAGAGGPQDVPDRSREELEQAQHQAGQDLIENTQIDSPPDDKGSEGSSSKS